MDDMAGGAPSGGAAPSAPSDSGTASVSAVHQAAPRGRPRNKKPEELDDAATTETTTTEDGEVVTSAKPSPTKLSDPWGVWSAHGEARGDDRPDFRRQEF